MCIGEAAKQAGVTIKTIRYYERLGLIPRAARNGGRFWLYDQVLVERSAFVAKARALGFTLEEIREIFSLYDQGHCTCGQVGRSMDARLRLIDSKLADLERLKRDLLTVKDRFPEQDVGRNDRICPVIHQSTPSA